MNKTQYSKNAHQNLLFLLCCIAASTPLWFSKYLPLVDLPQHAGQIAVLKAYAGGHFSFAHLYELNALSPYWLGYGLSWFFSYFVEISTAIKVTLSISVTAFPIACSALRSKIGAPLQLDWLFIALPFGFAYEWGFLNFLTAMPLCILFLVSVITHQQRPSKKSEFTLALWVCLLFMSHILATALFCVIASFMLYQNNMMAWFKRIRPLLLSIPLGVIWYVHASKTGQLNSGGPWGLGIHRAVDFLPHLFGLKSSITTIALSLLLSSLPFLFGAKIHSSPQRYTPFLLYTAWMLIGPNYFMGTFFVYQRFELIGIPLYLMAFNYSQLTPLAKYQSLVRPVIFMLAPIFALTIIIKTALINIQFDKEIASYSLAENAIPRQKKVISLIFERNSALMDTPVYLHFPSWYQAHKEGIVDFSFSSFFPQLLRYKPEHQPSINANFVWTPHTFDWERHGAENYDYIITRALQNTEPWLARISPNIKLTHSSYPWQVYKISSRKQKQPKQN